MEPAEIYAACRSRLLAQARSLSDGQLDAPLAATPPWTVLDGYRHLAGVCADVLDGVTDGAGSPAWTAAQLASRAERSIDEVCDEWADRGPHLDSRMAEAGSAMAFLAFDVWTHEQDIRAGAGLAGVRDDDIVAALVPLAVATFSPRYAASGAPPLRVIVDGQEASLGAGDPQATLHTTPYELLRIIFGRRSQSQTSAADWSGDSARAVYGIHLFDFPDRDLVD